jgi:cytochrome c biogenesis protein CcmG/thiol:disulfide interchange protein DsbE
MKRFILPLGVFVALLGFLWVGLRLNPREVPSPLIDKPAPAFALAQLHMPERQIGTRDMAGQVWILNVWASWCVACRQEHPVLMEMARMKLAPIVGLNYKDARDEGIANLQRAGDPYVVSAFDQDGRVGIDYGVYGVPETFVIDKRGVIRYKQIGILTPEIVTGTLVPLIAKLNREGGNG